MVSTLQGNWVCKALADVHTTQPFRKVQGPSGILEEGLWLKDRFVEEKDKYLCRIINPDNSMDGWAQATYLSPRFKVYVEEAQ